MNVSRMTDRILDTAQREMITQLKRRIRAMEASFQLAGESSIVSTGVDLLDRLLPNGGYLRGTLVEWLSPAPGCGAEMLSWLTAVRAARRGGGVVVIDRLGEFYPPAAAAAGIDVSQCLVVQPLTDADAYWAIDQSLRCRSVAAVWSTGALGPSPRAPGFLDCVHERWLRRFQLAAEEGRTLGLFVRPIAAARPPSWCDVRWRIDDSQAPPPAASQGDDGACWREFELHLLKCRGGIAGQTISLALNLHTGETEKIACRPVHCGSFAVVPERAKPLAPTGFKKPV